jgi:hypothetical protein
MGPQYGARHMRRKAFPSVKIKASVSRPRDLVVPPCPGHARSVVSSWSTGPRGAPSRGCSTWRPLRASGSARARTGQLTWTPVDGFVGPASFLLPDRLDSPGVALAALGSSYLLSPLARKALALLSQPAPPSAPPAPAYPEKPVW